MILDGTARSDARLIAYAVMPNHLHLVLQQGSRPLWHYMQPLLRRVALLVRRCRRWEGHVFERRYDDFACVTPLHLRNAITYVHLNGFRAALAETADSYEWCSQKRFCSCDAPDALSSIAMGDALRLFAVGVTDTLAECARNYRAFVRWRVEMDIHRATAQDENAHFHPPSPPALDGGDEHWHRSYAPFVQAEMEGRKTPQRRMDLRDLALLVLRELEPGMSLEDLRSGGSTRALVRIRKRLIQQASAAGYAGRAIARFLNVSPATVSSVRARM